MAHTLFVESIGVDQASVCERRDLYHDEKLRHLGGPAISLLILENRVPMGAWLLMWLE